MEYEGAFGRIKTILIMLALTFATLAVYWQLQYHEFTSYDDPWYVGNPVVRNGLSWEGIRWAFQSTAATNWHPMAWLSHMLDFQLFGKQPSAHHLTNLFFHLASTLLLFITLKEMTAAFWRSAFVAAMFALHPLHVESVAWVAERKDVLSAFFWFLTMAVYVEYAKRPARGKYLAALFIYILGLMAKPILVTLPFVLLLLDFWPLRRIPSAEIERHRIWLAIRPLLLEKIPFFACSLFSSVITYYVQQEGGAVSSLQIVPINVRITNAFISYAEYLDKTLWPRELAVFYPYPNTILLSKALGAALIVIFISIIAIYLIRRAPYLFVGWFWYLGTLVPVIGLVQVGIQASADRYTYLPLIGIFLILPWGGEEVSRRLPYRRIILSVCALLLLAHWSFAAWCQVTFWKNDISLFEHALSVTRDNAVAHNNLGGALAKVGRHDEAMRHFQEALRIIPSYSYAINNVGIQLVRRGESAEAMHYFRRAIQTNPRNETAYINLAVQLARAGNPESQAEAVRHLFEALRIDPFSFIAHYHLGLILSPTNTQDAIAHFADAIRLNPEYGMAHYQLGVIYSRNNAPEKALHHYQEALKCDSDPKLDFLHKNLADQLLLQGKTDEALSQMETALRINPLSPASHVDVGNFLMIQGQVERARHHFAEAVRMDPADQKAGEALKKAVPVLPGEKRTSGK